MNNTMQYKGYVGSVEFSEADGLFFGKVLGIRALISYEGTNAAELVADFHGAVDDYLSLCEAENSEPEKAYKGSFNIRVSPELHKQAAICAMAQQVSLNTLVEDALREYVAERKEAVYLVDSADEPYRQRHFYSAGQVVELQRRNTIVFVHQIISLLCHTHHPPSFFCFEHIIIFRANPVRVYFVISLCVFSLAGTRGSTPDSFSRRD